MYNRIILAGNLGRDPELRYTTSGRGVASFGLAVNRRFQRDGEWEEVVSFFNIVAWADLGENVAASIQKGHRVLVSGRLEQRSYETSDGDKRTIVEVIADDVGPSLKWAQCEIERITRDDKRPPKEKPAEEVYGEEEPF